VWLDLYTIVDQVVVTCPVQVLETTFDAPATLVGPRDGKLDHLRYLQVYVRKGYTSYVSEAYLLLIALVRIALSW